MTAIFTQKRGIKYHQNYKTQALIKLNHVTSSFHFAQNSHINSIADRLQYKLNDKTLTKAFLEKISKELLKLGNLSAQNVEDLLINLLIVCKHDTDSSTKTNWFGITNKTASLEKFLARDLEMYNTNVSCNYTQRCIRHTNIATIKSIIAETNHRPLEKLKGHMESAIHFGEAEHMISRSRRSLEIITLRTKLHAKQLEELNAMFNTVETDLIPLWHASKNNPKHRKQITTEFYIICSKLLEHTRLQDIKYISEWFFVLKDLQKLLNEIEPFLFQQLSDDLQNILDKSTNEMLQS